MPLYCITLDTGRLGDWLFVEAKDEDDALRKAKRKTRRKIKSARVSMTTTQWRAHLAATKEDTQR